MGRSEDFNQRWKNRVQLIEQQDSGRSKNSNDGVRHEALNQLGAVIFYHIGGIVHIVLAFQSLNESKGIL